MELHTILQLPKLKRIISFSRIGFGPPELFPAWLIGKAGILLSFLKRRKGKGGELNGSGIFSYPKSQVAKKSCGNHFATMLHSPHGALQLTSSPALNLPKESAEQFFENLEVSCQRLAVSCSRERRMRCNQLGKIAEY
jgi:hypothetical protein